MIRDSEFASRLSKACDGAPNIPPAKQGRQAHIARALEVSEEAVSKWFWGETRPRMKKMKELCKLLGVDEAWLALGVEPEMSTKDAKLASKRTEGVVYLALGMSMLAGAACARPSQQDPRKGFVDFYMIQDGEQVAVHAALGREVEDGKYEFVVPSEFGQVRNVGVIPMGGTRVHLVDLVSELIDRHKERKGGGYAVTLTQKQSEYFSGRDKWPRINDFSELV